MPSEQMQRKARTVLAASWVPPACYDWLFNVKKSRQVVSADVWQHREGPSAERVKPSKHVVDEDTL